MNEKIQIEYLPIAQLIPYEKNPRKNDKAVEIVKNSIEAYGFKVPIIIDKNCVIVAGHTRVKAAIQLGIKEVPVIWADDLTEEQIKALRLMDNKSHEYADWNFDLLKNEIKELTDLNFNMELTGFDKREI